MCLTVMTVTITSSVLSFAKILNTAPFKNVAADWKIASLLQCSETVVALFRISFLLCYDVT